MNPAIVTAGIGAISSALGGSSQAKQARLDREAADRARKEEIRQRQAEMRARVRQDTAGAASNATADHYATQVADDERNYGRANENATLPMRQDILNSLYARLGTYPMQRPGMEPGAAPEGGPPATPPQAPPGPGRQIDFSQVPEFKPEANRGVYDAAVDRVVGQAEKPDDVYQPPEAMTQADRMARKNQERTAAMDQAEAKLRAEYGDKLSKLPILLQRKMIKQVRHEANQASQKAFYDQYGR